MLRLITIITNFFKSNNTKPNENGAGKIYLPLLAVGPMLRKQQISLCTLANNRIRPLGGFYCHEEQSRQAHISSPSPHS